MLSGALALSCLWSMRRMPGVGKGDGGVRERERGREGEEADHGRWNKYVDTKNSTMNAGDAEVGIKCSGSQL